MSIKKDFCIGLIVMIVLSCIYNGAITIFGENVAFTMVLCLLGSCFTGVVYMCLVGMYGVMLEEIHNDRKNKRGYVETEPSENKVTRNSSKKNFFIGATIPISITCIEGILNSTIGYPTGTNVVTSLVSCSVFGFLIMFLARAIQSIDN